MRAIQPLSPILSISCRFRQKLCQIIGLAIPLWEISIATGTWNSIVRRRKSVLSRHLERASVPVCTVPGLCFLTLSLSYFHAGATNQTAPDGVDWPPTLDRHMVQLLFKEMSTKIPNTCGYDLCPYDDVR